jgi:hypothetical protein
MVSFTHWPLAAIAVTGLAFSSWKSARNGWLLLNNERSSDSQHTSFSSKSPELIGKGIRGQRLRWISLLEFNSLLARFSDLIFIDLRDGDRWEVLPLRTPVTAFCVRRHELPEILERLPESRIVVFYGITDLDTLLIGASPRADGVAPIYLLDFDSEFTEGA